MGEQMDVLMDGCVDGWMDDHDFIFNLYNYSIQVLQAATVIAKHTGTLCNACKLASSRTSNPVAKKEFVQFAKQVAGATAELVKNIKVQTVHVCTCTCIYTM